MARKIWFSNRNFWFLGSPRDHSAGFLKRLDCITIYQTRLFTHVQYTQTDTIRQTNGPLKRARGTSLSHDFNKHWYTEFIPVLLKSATDSQNENGLHWKRDVVDESGLSSENSLTNVHFFCTKTILIRNNQFNFFVHVFSCLTMLTISQGRYDFLILGIHDVLAALFFIFSTVIACVKS